MLAMRRGAERTTCTACGRQVANPDSAVKMQGVTFHAACALYTRPGSSAVAGRSR